MRKIVKWNLKDVTLAISGLSILCMSCVHTGNYGVKMHSSQNFNERKHPISMLVLHYTAIPTCEESLTRLCETTNVAGRVSAHYLVDRDGGVYNLVDESKRAWHAGLGSWAGLDDINSRSIGIEIVNAGLTEDGRREPFPDEQIGAVIELCREIIRRHGILSRNVVGHSDVSPVRKQDPGEAFPWAKLAEAGIGIWTNDFAEPERPIPEMLECIGYDVTDVNAAVIAFQRHWHPEAITEGATNTVGRIAALYSALKESVGGGL